VDIFVSVSSFTNTVCWIRCAQSLSARSGGFTQAAQDPTAFANSCYSLIKDPRWADVFDGIDIDWE
jgi:hypothetical protein